MSKSLRRFEFLLPLRFNDGLPVPNDVVAESLLQLERRFGAVSSETQRIEGRWHHEGQSYRDELMRVFVDAPDLPATRQFFLEFKEVLMRELRQIDIWMTTYPIEVLLPTLIVVSPCIRPPPRVPSSLASFLWK